MSERKYTVVAGSGAGGITLALLLAKAGRRVCVVECQSSVGGYLRRYKRDGVHIDTGYHFSGGFSGVMSQMNRVLEIDDLVKYSPITHKIVLAEPGFQVTFPAGSNIDGVADVCASAFPFEAQAVRKYFEIEKEIWNSTPLHDLNDPADYGIAFGRYDMVTAAEVVSGLGLSPSAALAVNSFAMCHGTPVSEAPMSFHARAGFCLHDDLSRPAGGGSPVIEGFMRGAGKYGIRIETNCAITAISEPDAGNICRFVTLSSGETLEVEEIFFTTHPAAAAAVLPEKLRTPSFMRRIKRLKESTSFFTAVFAVDDASAEFEEGLVSSFSTPDIDDILLAGKKGHSTGMVFSREPDDSGTERKLVTAFRTMRQVDEKFSLSRRERLHDAGYQEFKSLQVSDIEREILSIRPELAGKLRCLVSATPLTCLDYDPPSGSAYGARCVCGEARSFGRVGLSNIHFAGQSALVPGVMGTMLTSFSVFRQAVGEDIWRSVVKL